MKNHNNDIKELLSLLKQGDETAFHKIFHHYEKKLYYFIFSFTKSHFASEDLVQDVFIKIWNNRDSIDLNCSFDAFLFTIAKNLTYNHLRKLSNQTTLKNEVWKNLQQYQEQTEDSVLLSEYEEILESILEDLPIRKKNIFVLSKRQGKSNQEIAEILNITEKTVKNHLWKTLQFIKNRLQPYLTDTIVTLIISLTL